MHRYLPIGKLVIETGSRRAEDQQTVLLHKLHRKAMPLQMRIKQHVNPPITEVGALLLNDPARSSASQNTHDVSFYLSR